MEERSPDDGCAVPKIVWFSWLQGLDKAPEVVRVCLASRMRHLPDYEFRIFDLNNYRQWVELPDYVNTRDLAAIALENNVAFVPGSGFFPNGGNNCCMRLNYSCMPDERIVEGVHRLAEVIKAALK